MLQAGVTLFLFSVLEGIVLESPPFPRLGLSVHTLSGFEGVVLIAPGLLWPRLNLSATASRIAFWTLLYSVCATLVAYTLAAIWGAGNSTIPLAAGTAYGTDLQEAVIKVVVYTGGPTFLIAIVLIIWGLCIVEVQSKG